MLSKKTRYSFLALVYLAKEYQKGPVLISTIAESEKIPKKFLEAILLELRRNGYVNSKMGKGGGYYLIKPPDQINLADILRLFEGAIALLPCASFKYYEPCCHCKDENTCGIRSVIKDLRDETVSFMKNISLAEVIRREDELLKTF
jgi:Rrf2 family protein